MSQQDVRWRFYKSPSSSHATQYAELRFVPKRPATERQFSRPSSRSSSCSGSVTSLGSGLSASESRDFSRHHSLHLERLSRIRSSSRRSLARPRRLHDAKGRMATNLRYKQIQKQNSINKTKLAALKNERRRRPVVVALKKTRRSRRQTPTRPPWQSPMGRDDHGIILPPISRKGRRVMAAEHAARLGSSRWGRAPMTERNVRKAASTYRHAHPLFEAKKRAVAPSRPAWQWPAHLEHLAPAVAKVLSEMGKATSSSGSAAKRHKKAKRAVVEKASTEVVMVEASASSRERQSVEVEKKRALRRQIQLLREKRLALPRDQRKALTVQLKALKAKKESASEKTAMTMSPFRYSVNEKAARRAQRRKDKKKMGNILDGLANL